jgi:hypothetical protein
LRKKKKTKEKQKEKLKQIETHLIFHVNHIPSKKGSIFA